MSAVDPDRRAIIVGHLLATPVPAKLGIRLEEVQGGPVTLSLPFNPANVTRGDVAHGGVIAKLADVAAVAGAVSGARRPPSFGATATLLISYLRPVDGCSLLARSHVLRWGSRQHVMRVEIVTTDGSLAAQAIVTMLLA